MVLDKPAEPRWEMFDEKFFMDGDDLDLCIRAARGSDKVVYDGRVQIAHFKRQSEAKEYGTMSEAIFDANGDVSLKLFANSRFSRTKCVLAFALWTRVATLQASVRRHRRVQPL